MKRKTLVTLIISLNMIYLIWRTFYTLPIDHSSLALSLGLLLLVSEGFGFFELVLTMYLLKDTSDTAIPKVETNDWPSIDILIACYNEPTELIQKSINACLYLNYKDKTKINIVVCDDKRRDDLKELAFKMHVQYITRLTNQHAKAGNLNNALHFSYGDLILTLDADMIVHPDFLLKTVPFFVDNQKMGFVQTPHRFYNADTFQYNMFAEASIPNEQDFFHTTIQNGRSKMNAVIYAGSNTLISRKALKETGGFETGSITEDIATGIKLQSQGYQSVFVNEVLAVGLAPFNIKDLFTQRVRWALGTLQTFQQRKGHFKALNSQQKLMYSLSYIYWFNSFRRLIYMLIPTLFIFFSIPVVVTDMKQVLIFWLPTFVLNHYGFKYLSNGVRSPLLSHLYETIFAPILSYNLFKELIGFKQTTFKVTPKKHQTLNSNFNLRYFVPHLTMFSLLSIAFTLGMYYFYQSQYAFIYAINLFWIAYNLYVLFLSLLFASERKVLRSNVRVKTAVPIALEIDQKIEQFMTYDCSDNGLSIKTQQKLNISFDKNYRVQLSYLSELSTFNIKCVRIDSVSDMKIYGFEIVECKTDQASTYSHMIYSSLMDRYQNEKVNYLGLSLIKILKARFKARPKELKIRVNRLLEFSVDNKSVKLEVIEINDHRVYIRHPYLPIVMMSLICETQQVDFKLLAQSGMDIYIYQTNRKYRQLILDEIETKNNDYQLSLQSVN